MTGRRPYISALWHAVPANIKGLLAQSIHAGIETYKANGNSEKQPTVFFRADDIAIPSTPCRTMMQTFAEHETPLALAVVPAWSTSSHIQSLLSIAPEKNDLWCWHQHGWTHTNNEGTGRKCEFGDTRATTRCANELQQGHERLTELLGDAFYPLFTPPWNRISPPHIRLLKNIGFKAISRSSSAPTQDILPDIPINVDLHTRSELTAASGWNGLLSELSAGIGSGKFGIMLHHDIMNPAAEEFLHLLLITLQSYPVQSVPIYSYVL